MNLPSRKMDRAPLTLVTVVFDAEVTLLELQAMSVARYLDPASVAEIVVLDNCVFGLSRRSLRRLASAYGDLWERVRIIRTRDLIDPRATTGWRSQQAAKLAVATRVNTAHYVLLDAKNHFIRRTDADAFVGADGRAHGAFHGYDGHPLRGALEHTLRYLGADDELVARARASFLPTATPFVMTTAYVRELMSEITAASGRQFADEFERQQLLEFFLYSGWLAIRGPGIATAVDGVSIDSPTVWPRVATIEGVQETIAEAARDRAFVFAVHRQVLARADEATRNRIAANWVDAGLFPDLRASRKLLRRFRRHYLPALVLTRGVELLNRKRARHSDDDADVLST